MYKIKDVNRQLRQQKFSYILLYLNNIFPIINLGKSIWITICIKISHRSSSTIFYHYSPIGGLICCYGIFIYFLCKDVACRPLSKPNVMHTQRPSKCKRHGYTNNQSIEQKQNLMYTYILPGHDQKKNCFYQIVGLTQKIPLLSIIIIQI